MSTVLEPRMRPGPDGRLSNAVARKLAQGASRSENAVILGDRGRDSNDDRDECDQHSYATQIRMVWQN